MEGSYECLTLSAATSSQGFEGITLGAVHTCGIVSGQVRCAGQSRDGQIGSPIQVPDGVAPNRTVSGWDGAKAVSAGYGHTCAVLSDGHLECIGGDQLDQLGRPDGSGNPSVGVSVQGIAGASQIAAGWFFTCVIAGAPFAALACRRRQSRDHADDESDRSTLRHPLSGV